MSMLEAIRTRIGTTDQFLSELESFLVSNGVSQAELARAAGMERAQLNRYVKRVQAPTLEVQLRLHEAMDAVLLEP